MDSGTNNGSDREADTDRQAVASEFTDQNDVEPITATRSFDRTRLSPGDSAVVTLEIEVEATADPAIYETFDPGFDAVELLEIEPSTVMAGVGEDDDQLFAVWESTATATLEYEVTTSTDVSSTVTVDGTADCESGAVSVDGPSDVTTEAETESSLELLAEESVGHAHACSHARFDDRTPLSASEDKSAAPTVEETHVIWEVTYQEPSGYVTFDADEHWHEGPFVFYLADGTADVLEGIEVERDDVDDEDCELLDEYLVVDDDDGKITLELVGHSPLQEYTNQDAIIETDGLRGAIDDWRNGEIETDLLRDVIDAWRSGEPIS